MKKSKYDNFFRSGAVAVAGDSAFSGWAVYGFEYGINDYVIAGYVTADKKHHLRRYKIQSSAGKDSRQYFRAYGRRLYINNFFRVH